MNGRTGWGWTRSALGLGGALALGIWVGRGDTGSSVWADPPKPAASTAPAAPSSDYSQRVVAYIYNNVPITREELGEYLIARQGADKIELLVNKRIIEYACQEGGITTTAAEIEAALDQDCAVMGVNRMEFLTKVLKQYNKTLFEWKEDVLKPRLMLQKFCQGRIKIEDSDLKKEFESRFGEKIDCRIIIWPKGEEKVALKEYDDVRKSEESFSRKACTQAISSLAAVGGRIQPIARYAGAHPEVEKQAFLLQPGEVSRLIETPEGTVCLKIDRKVAADDKAKFETVREQLNKAVFDKKISQEIPLVMKEFRDKAKPVFILKKAVTSDDIKKDAERELEQAGFKKNSK